mmetsp:Transcript_106596/g.237911  ORF Transcript_106596/g.237911 Transcript_106596/m.237911 type:complete len:218 (-) Transcript_106596:132-785(-)
MRPRATCRPTAGASWPSTSFRSLKGKKARSCPHSRASRWPQALPSRAAAPLPRRGRCCRSRRRGSTRNASAACSQTSSTSTPRSSIGATRRSVCVQAGGRHRTSACRFTSSSTRMEAPLRWARALRILSSSPATSVLAPHRLASRACARSWRGPPVSAAAGPRSPPSWSPGHRPRSLMAALRRTTMRSSRRERSPTIAGQHRRCIRRCVAFAHRRRW